MNNRTLIIILLLLSFLNLPITASAATVSIPNSNANPNEVVSLPLNMDDASGTAGLQFTVTYDPTVLQATGTTAGDLTSGWVITDNTSPSGEIMIGGFDPLLYPLPANSGSLVKLIFNVIGNAGDTAILNITVSKLVDNAGDELVPAVSTSSGIFNINNVTCVSQTWTDPSIVTGLTLIRAVHINEMRTAVNDFRSANGIADYIWTNPIIIPAITEVMADEINELRSAIDNTIGSQAWSEGITPQLTTIKAIHIEELRNAITTGCE